MVDSHGSWPDTCQPDEAWKELSKRLTVKAVTLEQPPEVKPVGSLRLVFLSDTHFTHSQLTVPDGDVLIHTGDFTHRGLK